MAVQRICPAWLDVLLENHGRALVSSTPASNEAMQFLRVGRANIHESVQYLVSLWSASPSWDNVDEQIRVRGVLKDLFMRHAHFLHDVILPEEIENNPGTASPQLSQLRTDRVVRLENQVFLYARANQFRDTVKSVLGFNVGINEERSTNGYQSLHARLSRLFERATSQRFDMYRQENPDHPDIDVPIYNVTEAREETMRICNDLENGLYTIIMADVTRVVYMERRSLESSTTRQDTNATRSSQPRLTRTTHPFEETRGFLRFSDPDDTVVDDDDDEFSDEDPNDVPQRPPYRYQDRDDKKGKRPANLR